MDSKVSQTQFLPWRQLDGLGGQSTHSYEAKLNVEDVRDVHYGMRIIWSWRHLRMGFFVVVLSPLSI